MASIPDVHVHVHIHIDPDPRIDQILTKLDQTKQAVDTAAEKETADMATAEEVLANLQAAASRTQDAQQSVILLLQALHAEAVAAINSGNIAQFQAVADTLLNNADTLAAAVVSNPDPSAPAPTTGGTTPPDTGGTIPPDTGGGTTPPDTGGGGTVGLPSDPGVPTPDNPTGGVTPSTGTDSSGNPVNPEAPSAV